MIKKIFVCFLLILSVVFVYSQKVSEGEKSFNMPHDARDSDYLPATIIIKIKPDIAEKSGIDFIGSQALNKAFDEIGITNISKKFPLKSAPVEKADKWGRPLADISRIYELKYSSETDIVKAINTLLATGDLEYAQPHYLAYPLDSVPNDPLNSSQYHLNNINAWCGWGVWQGDTNMFIGITDWGTDPDHPDLMSNIKYNYDDPIDGIDNDNDGYTDNFTGWDLGENDNDPSEEWLNYASHGTRVCGIAAASTANGTGVSGVGFRCKFLPIKVAQDNGSGTMTYEGIVYAADHKCKVINCSWGSKFYPGPYGQDIIDYATINCDALVVAACGNDNNMDVFYPASYDYVLSVAATDTFDIKWSGSTFGYYVDIAAPGENIESTIEGGGYDWAPGTSMASPIVSGAAALVRSRFPWMSAMQAGEQLKVTSDVIDTLQGNLPYIDLLGAGRVNLCSALTDTSRPSIKFQNINYSDNNNGLLAMYDTVSISGDFINYLHSSTTALSVSLSSLSPFVQMIDSVHTIGVIPMMGSVSTGSDPFVFYIDSDVPSSHVIIFKLTFSDTNYRATQYFEVIVSIDFITIDTNVIATTITSNGIIGYNNHNSSQGVGFSYQGGPSIQYAGGLMLGVSASQVSDVIYGFSGGYDQDFRSVMPAFRIEPPVISDFDVITAFNDSLAGSSAMGVLVTQHSWEWNSPGLTNFVIIQYTIKNISGNPLLNLYAGIFMDWDIGIYYRNRVSFDNSNRMGYAYPYTGGTHAGIKLLTNGQIYHYAFEADGNNGGINILDGFSGFEKYTALKTNWPDAGSLNPGNDIFNLVSTGPYNLMPNDTIVVAFALLAADHLAGLQQFASDAQITYNGLFSPIEASTIKNDILMSLNPSPANQYSRLNIKINGVADAEIDIIDMTGHLVHKLFSGELHDGNNTFEINTESLPAGIYSVRVLSENGSYFSRLSVVH